MTSTEKIKKFIKDNELTFLRGRRGTETVIICGFALWVTDEEINDVDLWDIIKNIGDMGKDDSADEFDRIYKYAVYNNYANYWNTPEAHENYVFDEVLSSQE